MVVPINNNFSPLPFYEISGNVLSNDYWLANRPYSYGDVFDLITYGNRILPFQFCTSFVVDTIQSMILYSLSSALQVDLTSQLQLLNSQEYTAISFLYCVGATVPAMRYGRNYLVIRCTDTNNVQHTIVSDIFNNTGSVRPKDVIHIEYTNTHDLLYNGGAILIPSLKFTFELNLKTTIGKPTYSYDEQVAERLGYRYIESQISKKSFGFTIVAPEYLCDAMRIIPMCNTRVIIDELHQYNNISALSMDVDWEEQGNVAKVGVIFDTDTVVNNLAEHASISAGKTFTTIPVPPIPAYTPPTVELLSIGSITDTQFQAAGSIVSDGGRPVTRQGFCYSTSNTAPTLSDSVIDAALGTNFESIISGLTPGTVYYVRAFAINASGTSYSSMLSATTAVVTGLPTVLTFNAQNITDTTADAVGSVTDDGGEDIIECGICYGLQTNPTIADTTVQYTNPGIVSFILSLRGLTPNTTYHFRAYAININGVAYGEDLTFTTTSNAELPEVETTDAVSNGTTSVRASGRLVSDGGGTVSACGICYKVAPGTPTIADSVELTPFISPTTGDFTCIIGGLTANTEYVVRAFATNEAGTSYGDIMKVHTDSNIQVPSVTTVAVLDVHDTTAQGVGQVNNNGGAAITEVGFCISSINSAPTINDTKFTGAIANTFNAAMSGLTPSTTYYARAYAINSVGVGYGSTVTFTTKKPAIVAPTVVIRNTINITATSVEASAEITDSGGATVTERGFCYSTTNQNPTLQDNYIAEGSTGTGWYSKLISGLTPATTYYIRAYAINSTGVAYSDLAMNFTTYATTPTVTVEQVTDTGAGRTIRFAGEVVNDGGAAVTERGIYWYIPGSSNYHYVYAAAGGVGTFEVAVQSANFTTGQMYFYRGFARNSAGEAATGPYSFIMGTT